MSDERPNDDERQDSFEASRQRSETLERDLRANPQKYRVLTGDRPTGALHVGHYFGSLLNRVRIQGLGVQTYIVIADYQVLTDREGTESIPANVRELVLDYLAAGLDPESGRTAIFCHSQVPALNQLLLPFLTLVSMGELDRNPTVKEEIEAAGLTTVNAGMYTYPVHQAADILFCKGNVVPVGKDQLSHLELTRKIARRFNQRYAKKNAVFPEPSALLSEAPKILGLDGTQKMSKSRNNAIALGASADDTAKLIKRATTDTERRITYDPDKRPAVSNMLGLIALCTGETPEAVAERIGDGGGGALKAALTTALNDTLAPLRAKRAELAKDAPNVMRSVLGKGNAQANEVAERTLAEVRAAMNMVYG
ncbi:MAG TPA: tryptophan--tRNA ligase [Polyangiaceae bacterium]